MDLNSLPVLVLFGYMESVVRLRGLKQGLSTDVTGPISVGGTNAGV
jgi:hypothetical protein